MNLTSPFHKSAPRRCPAIFTLFYKQRPGEDVQKLYMRRGLDGEDRLLVDPDKIESSDKNRAKGKGRNTLGIAAASNDSKYLAVAIIPGGAENDTELHVIETATGRETGDVPFSGLG